MSEEQEPRIVIKEKPVSQAELEPKSVSKSEQVPTETCEDDVDEDIKPLSGNPFFHIDVGKSHVGDVRYIYQLVLPLRFTRQLPNKKVPVSLICGGRTWEMTYFGGNQANNKRFDIRWKEFAKDNKLKVGDACVFELMESSNNALKFKVQVLRGDFPSALQNGTRDRPIVVD